VSRLVELAADPAGLASRLRRPLPLPPNPHARRGTAFHAWLEQRFGAAQLLDLDELPGAADEGSASDDALADLQEAFLASDWADRRPVEAEVPFETVIAGVAVRGRMDAVFADPDGGFTVVDWKTGPLPDDTRLPALAVQLAAYRLAWADLAGVPPRTFGRRSTTCAPTSRCAPPTCSTPKACARSGIRPYSSSSSFVIVFQFARGHEHAELLGHRGRLEQAVRAPLVDHAGPRAGVVGVAGQGVRELLRRRRAAQHVRHHPRAVRGDVGERVPVDDRAQLLGGEHDAGHREAGAVGDRLLDAPGGADFPVSTTLPLFRCVRTSSKPASVSSSLRSAIATRLAEPTLIPRSRTAYRGTAGGYCRNDLTAASTPGWCA
jgi:hypothetical protein